MATPQDFRAAFHGFHREDVVNYIQYLTNKHNTELSQLKAQLNAANAELAQLRDVANQNNTLKEQLSQCQSRCAELEQQLSNASSVPAAADASAELEAYRRAERMEREAKERASQICSQANAILAEATAKVDDTNAQMGKVADLVSARLSDLQNAIQGSKDALRDAASSLYALKPSSVD